MSVAYVDTSCLVAIAFGERGAAPLARRIARFDTLVSSNLLEAELRSALAREETGEAGTLLDPIAWILPDRPLTEEIQRVLAGGHVRGADLWHLACALFFADHPSVITFLTLDRRQAAVAGGLGFRT